jgi:DNA-binding transcriptional LysR family regulator
MTVSVRGPLCGQPQRGAPGGRAQHLGIASLPEFTARQALAKGQLVAVLPAWSHLTNYAGTAWLLYPPNRFLARKLRVWIDFLVEALAAQENCDK